jgi:hypothetical protein
MINFSPKSFLLKCYLITCMLTFAIVSFCYSQTDTIFTNNEKIACSVKEITPDAVKYTFQGEDVINSVYKNTVQKIIFKSGRVQSFAESTSYKSVTNVMDYGNVSITVVESEVRGLYKLGDVSSKAKGTTKLSSEEKVKDRAYRKLKIEAAMFGANVIYISNQLSQGSSLGYFGSKAATNLTGIAYSSVLPDYDKFKRLVGTKIDFYALKQYKLGASDSDVSQSDINQSFRINNILNDNGIIYIEGNLQGEKDIIKFQLANFNDNDFSIEYKDGDTDYSFVIKL